MSTIKRFEDIEAWQTARRLTKIVYELTSAGGFSRDFGLKDQMRRAAVSVMSNVAEGFESRTSGLFLEFLGRAKGSAGELRAQFYVAQDAGYLAPAQVKALQDQCEKCSSQISRFMIYLKSNALAPKRSNLPTFQRSTDPDVSTPKVSNVPTSQRSNNPDVSAPKRSNVPTFQRSNDPDVSAPKRSNVPTFKRSNDA